MSKKLRTLVESNWFKRSIVGVILLKAPPEEMVQTHAAIVAGLSNGTLRPVVGKELSLAEAADAHEAVMAPGAFGKIVLTVGA